MSITQLQNKLQKIQDQIDNLAEEVRDEVNELEELENERENGLSDSQQEKYDFFQAVLDILENTVIGQD